MKNFKAFLASRTAKLERLWQLDEELRAWHDSGAWKNPIATDMQANLDKMTERQRVHSELRQMNCEAWEFDPKSDTSGLVVQRQRVPVGSNGSR